MSANVRSEDCGVRGLEKLRVMGESEGLLAWWMLMSSLHRKIPGLYTGQSTEGFPITLSCLQLLVGTKTVSGS
jgi:hypothetical protein